MKLAQRFKAAYHAFREGILPTDILEEDQGWSRLTASNRDLSPMMQDKALDLAYYLYETNPMAKRLVDMTAEYIVADGIRFRAEDQEVHQVIDDFWKLNNLESLVREYTKELGLWGEQCYQAFVNETNGRVRLGYHDPGGIKEVVQDPDNLLQIRKVVLKGNPERSLAPVVPLELGQDGSFFTGDTFFFKINSVLKSSRGRPDILASADFLDLNSEFIFSRAERSIFGNVWMWDVELEGGTQAEIEEFLKKHPAPKPGAVRGHNEKVKWNCVAPDLKAHDASYDARLLKCYCLGGNGFPEHFFGEGGDVNRATALEMYEPVTKRLTTRQQFVSGLWHKIITFVLDKAVAKRQLRPTADRSFQLFFPEISGKDMQKAGLTLLYLAQSLAIAVENGWISKVSAARVYAGVASSFGPNIQSAKDEADEKD